MESERPDKAEAKSLSTPTQSLIVIGTYGEKLGHVDGKGRGLYCILFDSASRRLVTGPPDLPFEVPFLGLPQLGGAGGLLNPTYLSKHRGEDGSLQLYVVDERYDGDGGSLLAVKLNEATAELTPLGGKVQVGGAGTCHVMVAHGGKHVLVANYMGGSVAAIERRADGSLGSRCALIVFPPTSPLPGLATPITFPRRNVARQEQAHAHMVQMSGADTILVPDLGSDVVWNLKYLVDEVNPLKIVSAGAVHESLAGGGPRHLALHPSLPICYVAFELTSLVAAFAIDPANGTISGAPLPPGAQLR